MGENTFSWNGLFNKLRPSSVEFGGAWTWGWVETLMSTLSTVMWILLALVGAAGGIYALYVGIKMARAESAEMRDENKKRLINIIVSIVVVIVLILFFNTFLPAILDAFGVFDIDYSKEPTPDPNKPNGTNNAISELANVAKLFLRMY